jgi:aminopeptidase N
MKKLPKFILVAVLLFVSGASAESAPERTQERVQLPSTVVPVRYDLTVRPDADKLTFEGSVRIDVEVKASTNEIVLNAADLDVGKVVLDDRATVVPQITPDPGLQTVTFRFPKPIVPGRHRLAIDYRGKIYEKPQGLFALTYDTAQGRERMLATQFEAADARRFLPS